MNDREHQGKVPVMGYAWINESGHWCVVLELPRLIQHDMARDPLRPFMVAGYGITCGMPMGSILLQPRTPTWGFLWSWTKIKLRWSR